MASDLSPLGGLDLNHLVTLRALLQESSVTRAAHRLGQSQPTVSRVLASLRATFGDPLLVRAGRQMVLTPFAEALAVPLERCLAGIDRLASAGGFTPASSDRVFRLLVPDLLASTVVPALVVRLRDVAPGVRLHVLGSRGDQLRALLAEQVDLVVGASILDHAELRTRVVLPALSWGVLLGPLHPAYDRGVIDRADWLASDHAQLAPNGRPDTPSPLDLALAARGLERRVTLGMVSPMALGELLARTPLIATLPRLIARGIAEPHGLRLVAPPVEELLDPVTLRLTWSETLHADPGHRWFRGEVARVLEAAIALESVDAAAGR